MKSSVYLIIFAALSFETYALPTQLRRAGAPKNGQGDPMRGTAPSARKRIDTVVADPSNPVSNPGGPTPPSTVSRQYHATCAKTAVSIKTDMDNNVFSLLPDRNWPDEFAWSGGFYITPDRSNAVAYGAAFRPDCMERDLGNVVIMEFEFDSLGLNNNPLSAGTAAQNFWNEQHKLGTAILEYIVNSLHIQPSSPGSEPSSPGSPLDDDLFRIPPVDEGHNSPTDGGTSGSERAIGSRHTDKRGSDTDVSEKKIRCQTRPRSPQSERTLQAASPAICGGITMIL
ncbi:hypothetical protein DFH06DRAFT_765838 [Mycena polygramma]|nr:hypothetical protein DFH06DRAFT_765838 [Mycena polygramma]